MDAGEEGAASSSVISTLGGDITRIVGPVSTCMLLVVLLVSLLSSSSSPSPLHNAISSSSSGDDFTTAVITAGGFVAAVTAATFLLALLFYLRCTACLRAYLGISSLALLLLLGGEVSLLLLARLRLPLDAASYALLLPNLAAAAALAALSPASVPIALNQAALLLIAVLTAYWFTLLPEWTTWALLLAMALYDLAAVLLPGGPLRLLLHLAMERNEELPALVYEARPVDPRPGQRWRLWRERRDLDASSTVSVTAGRGFDANSAPEEERRDFDVESRGNSMLGEVLGRERRDFDANVGGDPGDSVLRETSGRGTVDSKDASSSNSAVSEVTVPLVQTRPERSREDEEEEEGIGLSSSGAIKLGLGDFIFYSVLVGRAAMYDYMTVYACYLAIIAGLGITLLLLAFFRKALPALPVSITLGVVFYLLTRALLEAFVMQCSTNLLMF